jgi:hypothetical protein
MAEIPNIEKLLSDYLRAEDHRVVAQTPEDTSSPWVRLTLLGAPSLTSSDWLFRGVVQLDCYAGKTGGHPEATELAAQVRAMLERLPRESLPEVVVTDSRNVGHLRRPDGDLDPPRQRWILTQQILFHPRVSS